jgi:uncharacterized protein
MAVEVVDRPLIWVLKGVRAGDTAQAMALALALNGRVECKTLLFNASHRMPNWLTGPRVSHLKADAQKLLAPPWPDMVIATGRRTAPVALWIAEQSGGHSKTVQIGRPRMVLSAFDLVLTTPQYGLPPTKNTLVLPLPFTTKVSATPEDLAEFQAAWAKLPRPWIMAAIGGGKFPQRLGRGDLQSYGDALEAHAKRKGGSVIIIDSPRSARDAAAIVTERLSVPLWTNQQGASANPYRAALALCDHLVVTSDSASMLADMAIMLKPVLVYRLSVSPLAPRWSAQKGVAAVLAQRGILHPPRDTDSLVATLIKSGVVGDLFTGQLPAATPSIDAHQREIVDRVKALLGR